MTPKPDDAKPDPLEELKEVLEEMTGYRPFQDSPGREKVNRAIAAWEKERAEASLNRAIIGGWTAARDQYGEPSRLASQLAALRAAVEKVRDELIQTINVRPGAVMACHLREAADALDAALRVEA